MLQCNIKLEKQSVVNYSDLKNTNSKTQKNQGFLVKMILLRFSHYFGFNQS